MIHTTEHLAKFFDSAAELYDGEMTKARYFPLEWIPKHLHDIEGLPQCDVLDLACGTGLSVKVLTALREGVRAEGVDLSSKMLEKARATNRYERLYTHDLNTTLPEIPSQKFDLVIALGFLELLFDVNTCLAECHRVLKANGTLWASFRRFEAEDEGSPPRRLSVEGIDVTGYSAGEILRMMDRAGLQVIGIDAVVAYITRAGFSCPFYVVRARKVS